jgi:hypothetical protein
VGGVDSCSVGCIADSITLGISAILYHDRGRRGRRWRWRWRGRRRRTKLQTSKVFGTQLDGIPADNLAEIPLTFKVVVPPLVSTLHSNPALWSGFPIKKTPLTASKLAPVS